ncbi:MAG TPA: hypothetical protein VMB70_01210 [Terriglobia bacterium]|nr:hypothetical protein [Terriglobia bacterium]
MNILLPALAGFCVRTPVLPGAPGSAIKPKFGLAKLREDYRKAKGSSFTLQGFHDEFVKQGSIPIKAIRRILLAVTMVQHSKA